MTTLTDRPAAQSPTESRLSFRQPVDRSGSVDAGWWPQTNDLSAELPALLDVFWTAGRNMRRVIYNIDTWAAAPRRMVIQGTVVRLGGYHRQNRSMLSLIDPGSNDSADLLIIPFDTDPATAARLLGLASEPGNTNSPAQMLKLASS